MQMSKDVRDTPYLNHNDVVGLNFIRNPSRYCFRRHYRAGLRSHIMEILDPESIERERKGVVLDGLRRYPRPEPLRMLRIFRIRFQSIGDAEEEVKRVKIVQAYLAPDYVANSEEFLVDYTINEKREILLCGLQEYVGGEVINPWSAFDRAHLISLFHRMGLRARENTEKEIDRWIDSVRGKAQVFTRRIKQMIIEADHVPDLAGVGNLILTRSGHLKLVDVNNISQVFFDPMIRLDDRGYPVCDKSIEALYLLESKVAGQSPQKGDRIYETFMDPERMNVVMELDRRFHRSTKHAHPYYGSS